MILYTIGDSFTYGEELPNPNQEAYPAVLADLLQMDLVNEGTPGVGNEFIIKKTIQAVPVLNPDLVVVGWTSCGRQEHADDKGVFDVWPGYIDRKYSADSSLKHRLDLVKYITTYNNDHHEYRHWLRQVILLQSFLEVNNIPYIFCTAFDNQQRNIKYRDQNQEYWRLINTVNFAGWPDQGFVEWAYPYPRAERGHPLQSGHKAIADKLYEFYESITHRQG